MSAKHDDAAGYPRDCYPTRASRVRVGGFDLNIVTDPRVPPGAVTFAYVPPAALEVMAAIVTRPLPPLPAPRFPADQAGLGRSELVRLGYARQRTLARYERRVRADRARYAFDAAIECGAIVASDDGPVGILQARRVSAEFPSRSRDVGASARAFFEVGLRAAREDHEAGR
jgi:hypothetical protein